MKNIIKRKRNRVKLLIALFLLLIIAGFSPFPLQHTQINLQDTQKKVATINNIYIPSLSLFLPVKLSKRINQEWEITGERTTFFGEGSSFPGTQGTTVIFAHAQEGLFAKLPLVKIDDKVGVVANEKVYIYSIKTTALVSADETQFIKNTGSNTLVLFTCYGPEDKKRIVFFGNLIQTTSVSQLDPTLYIL